VGLQTVVIIIDGNGLITRSMRDSDTFPNLEEYVANRIDQFRHSHSDVMALPLVIHISGQE